MFRINYLPPQQMPAHQRDFLQQYQPGQPVEVEGSRALGLMVVWYLVAVFTGIVLLGNLVDPVPDTSTAVITGALSN